MAATRAQRTPSGRRNYGKNYDRGIAGERRAQRDLRREGYKTRRSPGSRGRADVIAQRGNNTRRVQVKNITSRSFSSPEVARRRIMGAPFNVPPGTDCIVYDRYGRRYRVRT